MTRMEPLQKIEAGVLEVAYFETGPADGPPVLLMHGFPYDIHTYAEVAPMLAGQGCRVIVPYLRGYGATRFLSDATPRSGEQAALGADLLALLDALKIERAVLAGYDWGGRAACVVAALWPERVAGLVSFNSYNIQNIAKAMEPDTPANEHSLWYQYYFHSERGRAGLEKDRRAFTKLLWKLWSPTWKFDDATFERSASAFDHPDFVDVVIQSYRHRFGLVPGDPAYADIERRLAAQPAITVPTITFDGIDDGVRPPAEASAHAHRFSGPRSHRLVPGVGHNMPQEAPRTFADAVLELVPALRNNTPMTDNTPKTLSEHHAFGGVQSFHEHRSHEIGLPMRFSVYLPPQAANGPVPALLYLAGLTCNEETFAVKAGAQRMAASLGIALIAPDTSPRGAEVERIPGAKDNWDFGIGAGFYLDALAEPWATHWRMESWIVHELLPLVAAHFAIDGHRVGIFGHSMGGHGALTLALRHPGRFKSLSAFAPICAPTQCPWGEKAFAGYLGAPGDDRAQWLSHDASALMKSQVAAPYPQGILIDQGLSDKFLAEQLHPEAFEAACFAAGQPLTLRRHAGYDHGYYFIQTFMADHIAHHAQSLRA